jgi:hypothetical protein
MKTHPLLLTFLLIALSASAHPGHDEEQPIAAAGSSSATNQVSITIEGDYRVIRANGLPNHAAGEFPNRNNPNRIAAQHYVFRVPVNPTVAAKPTRYTLQIFGIAVNGVVFDPGANEWWNGDRSSGWQVEAMGGLMNLGMDKNNAHVQPNGAYHYHGVPTGLLDTLTGGKPKMVLIGWAADGFPIYGPWGYTDPKNATTPLKKMKSSYRVKKGSRPNGPGGTYDGSYVQDWEYVDGAGDLDECNGRFGVTPEFPQGTYHYYVTETFPFISRQYKGAPDPSFERRGPPGGGPGGRGGKGRPPPPPPQ